MADEQKDLMIALAFVDAEDIGLYAHIVRQMAMTSTSEVTPVHKVMKQIAIVWCLVRCDGGASPFCFFVLISRLTWMQTSRR